MPSTLYAGKTPRKPYKLSRNEVITTAGAALAAGNAATVVGVPAGLQAADRKLAASRKAAQASTPKAKAPKASTPKAKAPKAPRAAKDLKPGDMRSKILNAAEKGASKAPSIGSRILGGVLRNGLRATGVAGALVGMTLPAGAGSDKPSGPLMKGNASAGGGRRQAAATYTKSYDKPASPAPAAPKKSSSYFGDIPSASKAKVKAPSSGDSYFKDIPKARQGGAFAAKQQGVKKGSTTPPAYSPSGPSEKRGAVTTTKMTNFQRTEARRIENEGVGGRSMTRDQAKAYATTPAAKRKR